MISSLHRIQNLSKSHAQISSHYVFHLGCFGLFPLEKSPTVLQFSSNLAFLRFVITKSYNFYPGHRFRNIEFVQDYASATAFGMQRPLKFPFESSLLFLRVGQFACIVFWPYYKFIIYFKSLNLSYSHSLLPLLLSI